MPDFYGGDDEGGMDEKPSMAGPDKEQEEKDTTALLPKSILAGKEFKPGDEVILKVVHIYEDEVEVEYSHGDEGDEEHEGSMMEKAKNRMRSMSGNPSYGD